MSQEREYICRNYARRPEFASFLPGIAGITGIPLWCYYVNRGQGVVSFGSDNKDHAIMEFYPAHVAYQRVSVTGFRTFVRMDGATVEPFSDPQVEHEMRIRMNSFDVIERNTAQGLETKATYFILPEEDFGALVRRVTITNRAGQVREVEIADGMPALIPYGVNNETMKEMTQLAKAWMQVEDAETGTPFFRVRASMEDTASVQEVKGGNFCLGFDETGARLPVLVDGRVLFDFDSTLRQARVLQEEGLDGVYAREQAFSNQLPCAFFTLRRRLEAGESVTLYELYGHADSRERLQRGTLAALTGTAAGAAKAPAWLEGKLARAGQLTEELGDVISTRTGHPDFDAYCRYTYMDNVLRGGLPVEAGGKVFYVYSRKHGDLEREYNYFSMSPEPCSQGNGNFRDVNQNRRCDPFYTPQAGRKNLHLFYSLIQPDGYNPLSVEKMTYTVPDDAALRAPFTPGALYTALREKRRNGQQASAADSRAGAERTEDAQKENLRNAFDAVLSRAQEQMNASFKEGYWSDHWTYNLDLVESYLGIWPEQEEDVLTERAYTWYRPEAFVNPRAKRYEETENGIRQYHAVTPAPDAQPGSMVCIPAPDSSPGAEQPGLAERNEAQNGGYVPCRSTLFEKLIALCALKTATLDPMGMGVEMEGGKPGWYDALNGLPGLLGSSMAETCELARMLHFTIGALRRYPGELELLAELDGLLCSMQEIMQQSGTSLLARWHALNDTKEAYRAQVYAGLSGKTVRRDRAELADVLALFLDAVEDGIGRSLLQSESGILPTYFTYRVTDYEKTEAGIQIRAVEQQKVPDYLEGPVRCLKLPLKRETRQTLYTKVKESGLYDRALSMYKVNAPLTDASYEVGRVKCFTPGWLENESIWLHMEYKYLLELLRSGLFREFAEDFHNAAIPFLDEETYGRSILENSSFLVSSANPDRSLHGRGFVARLSGSTAEFLSIWQIMMFGQTPFTVEDGVLTARFAPALPAYLIGEERTVTARFMGHTDVTYHFPEQGDWFPGTYTVERIGLQPAEGAPVTVQADCLRGDAAKDLRAGRFRTIQVYLRR